MEKEVRRAMAEQLLYYLTVDTESKLRWKGTKTSLIEVVSYLYYTELVQNEYGVPASMLGLSKQVCLRFGLKPMKSLSRVLQNINSMKGVRSQTLLQRFMLSRCRTSRMPSINTMILAIDN